MSKQVLTDSPIDYISEPITWLGGTHYGLDVLHRQMAGRIAELEAQLATTWQPIPNGFTTFGEVGKVLIADNNLKAISVDQTTVEIGFSANVRLCRMERAK